MRWVTLGTSARIATAALAASSLLQLVGVATEPGFNTAAGVAVAVALLGLAGLAATGRWWALAVVAAFGVLLSTVAVGQITRLIGEGEPAELLRVLAFQALTLTTAIAGLAATLQGYRSSHAG